MWPACAAGRRANLLERSIFGTVAVCPRVIIETARGAQVTVLRDAPPPAEQAQIDYGKGSLLQVAPSTRLVTRTYQRRAIHDTRQLAMAETGASRCILTYAG